MIYEYLFHKRWNACVSGSVTVGGEEMAADVEEDAAPGEAGAVRDPDRGDGPGGRGGGGRRRSIGEDRRREELEQGLSAVKESITKITGVGELYMRSFNQGTAEIEVHVNTVTSGDIANILSSNSALGLKVISQTQDSLELQAN